MWSGNKNKRKSEDAEEEILTKRVKARRVNEKELNKKSYTGITSKLGEDKLRSNFTLKSQAKLHMRTMKKQKKLTKTIKQSETAKKEKKKKMQDNMPVRYNDLIYILFYILYFTRIHTTHTYFQKFILIFF